SEGFLEEPLAWHRVEDNAKLASALGIDGFAGANQFGRQRGSDQARQPLGAPPAGDDAELHFRQANLGFRMIAAEPIIEAEGKLQPAADTRAFNGGDRGKRQLLE